MIEAFGRGVYELQDRGSIVADYASELERVVREEDGVETSEGRINQWTIHSIINRKRIAGDSIARQSTSRIGPGLA